MLEPPATGTPFEFLLIGVIAGSISITAACLGLARWLYVKYNSTIGRRRVQAKKLRRLACGVRAEYIEELLGASAYLNKSSGVDGSKSEERIYVLPDAFVRIHCAGESVVEAFTVTTRSKRFAPKLEIPWGGSSADKLLVRLGRTKYAELDQPMAASGWAGVRHWGYNEAHYLGNPGFYQTYILGSNDGSPVGWPPAPDWTPLLSGNNEIDIAQPSPAWDIFRRAASPNTFCVVGPHVDWERFRSYVGVEMDMLRVLPDE